MAYDIRVKGIDQWRDLASILATAYLRLLSQRATKPQATAHLAEESNSQDSASERLDFSRGTPMTCGGQDGGRNANPSKELR